MRIRYCWVHSTGLNCLVGLTAYTTFAFHGIAIEAYSSRNVYVTEAYGFSTAGSDEIYADGSTYKAGINDAQFRYEAGARGRKPEFRVCHYRPKFRKRKTKIA